MGISVITPPGVDPVLLDDAKLHLRVDDDNSDDLITSLITAATNYVETQTRQALMPRTLLLSLDAFPYSASCDPQTARQILLPWPPLLAVTGITYIDPTGATQTLNPATYTVDTASRPGRIVLAPGASWPPPSATANAVKITFRAGYSTVPELAKAVVKLLVGEWFERRTASTDSPAGPIPFGVQAILNQFTFPEVG